MQKKLNLEQLLHKLLNNTISNVDVVSYEYKGAKKVFVECSGSDSVSQIIVLEDDIDFDEVVYILTINNIHYRRCKETISWE